MTVCQYQCERIRVETILELDVISVSSCIVSMQQAYGSLQILETMENFSPGWKSANSAVLQSFSVGPGETITRTIQVWVKGRTYICSVTVKC